MKKHFVMIFSALMVVILCLASASALADDGTWERACVDSEFAEPCKEPPFGDNENGLPQPGTVLPNGGADIGTWERACVDSEFAEPCTEPPFGDNENGLPQPGTVLPIGGTDDSYSRFIIKK